MDYPQVFRIKISDKPVTSLEECIMETVRPRSKNSWAMYNKKTINSLSNPYDQSDSSKGTLRKVIKEQQFKYRTESTNAFMTERDRIKICNNVNWTEALTTYCEKCSLHGLKYVGDLELHPLERLFWAMAFILAVITSAYFISLLYQKWDNNPVIVSIGAKATQLIDIPFPAVTVCTMNKAKKSVAEEIIHSIKCDDAVNRIYIKYICEDENSTAYIPITDNDEPENRKWDAVQNFMTRVRQPCHEMLLACYYGGHTHNCTDIFNPSLTDEGICCSFNKVKRDFIFRNPRDLSDLNVTFPMNVADWTPEEGYPRGTPGGTLPWRPRGAGAHLGLTLVLDASIDDYYCSSTSSVGFKFRLHNPVETPKVAEFGHFLSPGREYRVAIKPTITNSSASLQGIPKNKRQCVFSNEKYLKFYRTYTQRNCALECEANYTLEVCQCVPYYLPKDANTTICGQREQKCSIDARRTIEMRLIDEFANTTIFMSDNEESLHHKPSCQCLPGCSELNYHLSLSSAHFGGTFPLNNAYTGVNQKNDTYFKKNVAIVHFYFMESQFFNYYKTELFGFTEFLSNTGGLLGLFLGFSFLSAVEMVYFVSLRLWCSLAKKRQSPYNQKTSILLTNPNNINTVAPYPFTQ